MTAALAPPRLEIVSKRAWVPEPLAANLKHANPRTDLGRAIRNLTQYQHLLPADALGELLEALSRSVVLQSQLSIMVHRVDPETRRLTSIEDYGPVGWKVITDVGVGYLVDSWQNSVELENQKYHGLGTGSTAENQTDTALVTELTTEYTGNVRATGTTTEGASANIFRTVATNTLDGTPGAALREHGIFSASTVGVLWDRTVYAAITLSSGESLATTYDMTASANG